MINITCDGGSVGRIWWRNSDQSGFFPQWGQPSTVLSPGRVGWDETWPNAEPWPPRPWGPVDFNGPDDMYADFVAFERWLDDTAPKMENVLDTINLYAWACRIHDHGVRTGRNPWRARREQEAQP